MQRESERAEDGEALCWNQKGALFTSLFPGGDRLKPTDMMVFEAHTHYLTDHDLGKTSKDPRQC
jgi:hypothetical protein